MSSSDSHNNNPRNLGFNYGIGWGKDPKPPAYLTGLVLERLLNKRASLASQKAWVHSMLVRDVRLAETAPEKVKVVQLLHESNERIFAENRDRMSKRSFRQLLKRAGNFR